MTENEFVQLSRAMRSAHVLNDWGRCPPPCIAVSQAEFDGIMTAIAKKFIDNMNFAVVHDRLVFRGIPLSVDAGEVVSPAVEEMLAQGTPPMLAQGTTTWPRKSQSLGCLPKQVEAMNDRNAKHGIATRYTKTGDAVIPTSRDMADLVKLEQKVIKFDPPTDSSEAPQ